MSTPSAYQSTLLLYRPPLTICEGRGQAWTTWCGERGTPGQAVAVRTYLGRKVVWGAAERPDGRHARLCEAEVCELDVAVAGEQNILGLEVAVDDVVRVEIVERERDLGRVELRDWVHKALKSLACVSPCEDQEEVIMGRLHSLGG